MRVCYKDMMLDVDVLNRENSVKVTDYIKPVFFAIEVVHDPEIVIEQTS